MQRSLQYHPDRQRTSPAEAGIPSAQEITLDTADGEKVIVWSIPPKGDRPLILYFHGNGGALRDRADRFRALTADGTGLVALSYRGYGGSSGSPSETGLIADAETAYRFALTQVQPERIAVIGESLGTGVAVAIAAEHKVGRVILESPFTSAADIGAGVYWYLPVRLLMKDPFYSDPAHPKSRSAASGPARRSRHRCTDPIRRAAFRAGPSAEALRALCRGWPCQSR
jgi:pimeloyl-ACP methyl ester carboxylesterase